MKRSTMLGNIYNILYMNTDLQEELLEELSNMLLDKIEKEGMSPPPDRTEMYYSSDQPEGYCPQRWEEENNEKRR